MSKKRDLKKEKEAADAAETDLWYRIYPGGSAGTDPVAYEQGGTDE